MVHNKGVKAYITHMVIDRRLRVHISTVDRHRGYKMRDCATGKTLVKSFNVYERKSAIDLTYSSASRNGEDI